MSLEQTEREKYEKVWNHPSGEYRSNSPGERLVPHFLEHMPAKPGESIIDLGCGTGRAGALLKKHGFDVWLFDHVDASEVKLPFILGNLWDLSLQNFDWFYCCDVMEHIPPEKVDITLDNIRVASTKGGYFQIALFENEWFGEVLHLTVKPSQWWFDALKARWADVRIMTPESNRIVAIVKT